ncbi:MAG: hypothetical protein CL624_09545 [Arcobacter sp.]|nr:hypothetical protein [Arcobacter sp.]
MDLLTKFDNIEFEEIKVIEDLNCFNADNKRKFMIKKLLLSIFVCSVAYAEVGTLSKVIDGDTVKFGQTTCRLAYIDTPESRKNKRLKRIVKSCSGVTINTMIAAGKKSTSYLKAKLKVGKQYKYTVVDIDRYKRSVCIIMINNRTSINQQLVKDGYAVPYYRYIKSDKRNMYRKLSKEAKRLNEGLYKSHSSSINCLEN